MATIVLNLPEDVLVLCYHALGESSGLSTTVSPERFRHQIDALRRRRYAGVTFTEALTAPSAGRAVAITFDDASRSVIDLALPIMRAAGYRGTVFAPTAYIGTGSPPDWFGLERLTAPADREQLTCMSWEELGALIDQGWEVGSHTRTHPRLSELGDGELMDELQGSRADCEEGLGGACRTLAYPYGYADARVVAAAHAAGYVLAANVGYRPSWPVPLQWPRVGITADDSPRRFRLRTSAASRRVQATVLGGRTANGARRLKRRVGRRRNA